jgi:hypothetical protein
MRQQNILRLVAGLLLLEAVAAFLLPSPLPRAARIPTAGTALVGAIALWHLARQKYSK